MVRNNYNELNKATLATWVDKALVVALSKRNIKSQFQDIGIWPFNPKAMDGSTKPGELYTIDCNNSTLDEHNEEKFDEAINDTKGWGEDGTSSKLISITTIIHDTTTTRIDVDG